MDLNENIILVVISCLVLVCVLIPVTSNITDENVLDVIMVDGQSNGDYVQNRQDIINLTVTNEELGEPKHKALYYGSSNASENHVSSSFSIKEMYRDGKWAIGAHEAGLAYYLMEKDDRDVLVLNIAYSGKNIEYLSEGNGWIQGKEVLTKAIADVKKSYDRIEYVGWVMIHGEADKNMPIDYYEDHFMILDGNLKKYGFEECYIVLPRIVGSNSYNAMLDLAEKHEDIHIATGITSTFTTENGLLCSDNIHYTQLGRILIDEAVVEYIPKSNTDASALNMIINTIPIFVAIGIIIGIVTYFKRSPDN